MITIREYQIIDVLGKGSSGIVFHAFDQKRKIYVAVKTIRMRRSEKWNKLSEKKKKCSEEWNELSEALHRESKILERLQGRGVPKYIDFFYVKKIPYLIMEYVEGVRLIDYVNVSGPLSEEEIHYIARKLLALLEICQKAEFGICHGDISPQNIMITSEKDIVVVDFGNGNMCPGESKLLNYSIDLKAMDVVILFLMTGRS